MPGESLAGGVFRTSTAIACMIVLVGLARGAWADELGSWYRSDPRSTAYLHVRPALSGVFADARGCHVPQWLLVERLREGSAKGASPDMLQSAVRAELARLVRAHRIIDQTGLAVGASGDATLKEIGVFLRAGLPDQVVGELLAAGRGLHGGRESALAACGAIMDFRAMGPVADADSVHIGRLLMASGMEPSRYGSLALVYDRGKIRGLSHELLVHEVIINTLSAGGGLSIMNQKIESTPVSESVQAEKPVSTPAGAAKHPSSASPAKDRQKNRGLNDR